MGDPRHKKANGWLSGWQCMSEALPYPVSIQDKDLNLVVTNQAFKEMFNYREATSPAKCYNIIHGAAKPPACCPVIKILKNKRAEQVRVYIEHIDRHLLIHTSPLYQNNRVAGIIHSITDVTDLHNTIHTLSKKELSLLKSKDAFFNMLEDLSTSYHDLETLFISLIKTLVNTLDAKSPWTRGHSERVADYAGKIAIKLGHNQSTAGKCRLAGLLHDIGKIGTRDSLLNKVEHLSEREWQIIKKHPVNGEEILKDIKQLEDITPIIRHHHERLDGRGYPDGLGGEEIPPLAKILHVADSFDSMTSDRPYRATPGREYAFFELKHKSGTQFDPKITRAFIRALRENTL